MSSITPERKDLHIPYEERQEAKKAAGKLQNGENALSFDKESKVWYAKPGADLDKVKKWLPENRIQERTPTDPRDEFADALVSAGFEIDGLPAMDGKKHRVRVDGDKAGQKSGVYKAYLDGVPAGWYQNHREHSEPVKWVSSGQRMDADELTKLRLEAAQKLREREAQQQRKYDHNAQRVSLAHSLMPDATGNESYLANKGVKAFPGVKTDKQGRVVIPLQDADDNIRSLQRINDTGFKALKKDAQKTGNYFVVGGELKNGEPVLYAEGYSTAASISDATKRPVVMTVDAGNLPKVAESLKTRYPDSQHVILGDDDRYKETNKGREKATEAAEITGGIAHFPKFSNPREGLTDFNDLHKSEGLEAVRMQVEEAITTNQNKVETMSEKNNDTPQRVKELSEPGAVITPKFEQEMDAYLSSRYEPVHEDNDFSDYANYAAAQPEAKDPEPVTKPAPATVAIDAEPVTKPAPATVAIDAEPATKPAPATVAIDAEPATKTAPATVAIDAEPATKPAPATVASDVESVENSIEPYREQEKALNADEDVKAWLSERRVSTADLIASDNERENRHAASMNVEGATTPPESKKKNQQAEKHDDYFAEESHRPVMPERIAKAYTQIDDRYYFQGRPDSLAFVDKGEKLQTKISNAQVAGSLVEIAEARGWEEIQLKGTQDFKREAWLQATAKGMTAHGYTPKEADLIRLKELSDKTKINEVSNAAEAQAAKAPVSGSAASKAQSATNDNQTVDLAKESGSVRQNAQSSSQAATENVTPSAKPATNPLEGTLKEHGKAPYEFKEGKKENYFVKLENADGKENVHWGLDLERAIEKAEVQPGDKVELARTGRKEVIVKEEIKDDKGKVIAVEEKATHRNTWEVKADAVRDKERPAAEVVKEHPDLVNEIATVKLAEKFSQGMDSKSRAAFMDGVREKLANDVQQGKQAPEVKIKEERSSSQTKTVSKEPEIER